MGIPVGNRLQLTEVERFSPPWVALFPRQAGSPQLYGRGETEQNTACGSEGACLQSLLSAPDRGCDVTSSFKFLPP